MFQDGEFASNPFYLVTGSLQGFNVSDRALISKTYQVSARDGDTTHSLQVDDRVPEGYPVLTYQKQERVRLVDIAGGTVDVFDPVGGATRVVTVEGLLNDPSLIFVPPYDTVLDSGKTLRETIQEALRVNPYAMFSMTSSNYILDAEARPVATSSGYSWSSRDGNRSWNLSVNRRDRRPRPRAFFTATERVSHAAAVTVANQITDPVKKSEALASLANDPAAQISMSVTGDGAPVYQWTNSLDPNESFSISENDQVPVGVNNAPTGKEWTFNRSLRVSKTTVLAQMQNIPDPDLRNAKIDSLKACTNCVFFNEQRAGNDDPSYQWTELGDASTSYSLVLNTSVPVGIPNAQGVYPSKKTEATYSVNTRVSKAEVLARIQSDAAGEWIVDPEARAAALAAYNAQVAVNGAFYLAQSGAGEPVISGP